MLGFSGIGQTASYKADILKACNTILGSATYSIALHYKMFLDNNLVSPFQERQVKMLRDGDNFYINQSTSIEVVETKSYEIILDHKAKKIAALARPKAVNRQQQRKEIVDALKMELDSLLKITTSIVKLNEDKKSVKYACKYRPQDLIESVEIEIDKQSGFYSSITTKYKQPNKIRELNNEAHYITMVIEYSGFTKSPIASSKLFVPEQYIKLVNGQIASPSERYKHYTYFNTKS